MMRRLLRWLYGDDDLGAVPITAQRLLEGEAYTERQSWGWAGPAQANPTAAQRARRRM